MPGAVPALHHMPGHRAWALCAAIAEGAEVWHKASRLYAAFLLLPGAGEVGRGDHPSRVPGREGCTAPLQSSSLSLQMLALTQTSGRAGLGFVVPVLRVGERLLLQPTTKSHRSHSSPASPECRKHYNSKSPATKAPKTVLHPSHISDPHAPEQFLGPTGRQPQAMATEAESSISRRDIPTFPPPGSRAWTVSPVSPRAQGRLCLEKGEPEALLKHKAGCCQTCSVGRVPGTSPKVLHKGSSVRQLQVKAARHSGLPGEGVGICCRRQGQPKPEGLPQTCVSCWEPSVQPQHRARALWQSCTAAAGKS